LIVEPSSSLPRIWFERVVMGIFDSLTEPNLEPPMMAKVVADVAYP
jgi:hypothetical protein